MRILVVDDDKNIVSLFQDQLELAGHEVDIAYSGPPALQKLKQRKPDLLILDILMPGLTGLQIIGMMRRDPDLADVPVILSSATDGPTNEEAKRLAIVDFLRKPVDFVKFRKIIGDINRKKEEPKILIVDDNEEDIKLFETLITKQIRCTIIKAMDGDTAFELAQEKVPDLILMDYFLPGKDGLELSKELKRSKKTCDIPIILISAYMPSNAGKESFLLGNGVNTTGSFDPEELTRKVKEILGKSGGNEV